MRRVIIIGGGLSGLECGYVLSKQGYDVTVLEHDLNLGGCIRSFKRGNNVFDTGFHYVGGLKEGESLHPFFKYFNLLDLPWQQLDEDCFDEINIGTQRFAFANGHERFAEQLTAYFPHEKDAIRRYVSLLRETGIHLTDAFSLSKAEDDYFHRLFATSAKQYITDTFTDPLLKKLICGTSLKMELTDHLPLYVFAQINNSYVESAWRIKGGGQLIAERLAAMIRAAGGVVCTGTTVTKILENNGKTTGVVINGKATGVVINGEETIEADTVICSQHPQAMLQLLSPDSSMRKVYRTRINNLQNTFGFFTAHLQLKPNTLPYENKNIYVHSSEADLWHHDSNRTDSVLVSYYPSSTNTYCSAVDLLTPMRWSQVEQWADTAQGHRGDDYLAFKQNKTEQCLRLVEQRLPQLRDAIEHIYTSTPLTYHHYTLAPQGCAYGIAKDCTSPLLTLLSPRTPLQGLYLTGQSLNLHGILGTTISALLTCREIVGDIKFD